MDEIIPPNKLLRHLFQQIQTLEIHVPRKQMLRRDLMQSNIEPFQALGFWIFFRCF